MTLINEVTLSFCFTPSHKANYPLMKNCIEFYHQYKDKYKCERGKTKHGALANILLCLEKAVEDGNYDVSSVGCKNDTFFLVIGRSIFQEILLVPKSWSVL